MIATLWSGQLNGYRCAYSIRDAALKNHPIITETSWVFALCPCRGSKDKSSPLHLSVAPLFTFSFGFFMPYYIFHIEKQFIALSTSITLHKISIGKQCYGSISAGCIFPAGSVHPPENGFAESSCFIMFHWVLRCISCAAKFSTIRNFIFTSDFLINRCGSRRASWRKSQS